MLAALCIDIPTEEDFESADLNGDGTLLFEEWREWVEEQGEETTEDSGEEEESADGSD